MFFSEELLTSKEKYEVNGYLRQKQAYIRKSKQGFVAKMIEV